MQLVVFLDDLNVIQFDSFDVQPPLEVLRQVMDAGMICDPKTLQWKVMREFL